MFYVYILQSLKDNNLYVGMTSDLENRIKRHNSGYGQSTKNRAPFELIHVEEVETREEARRREKFFKSGIGREIVKSLLVA
jgi:putative endonuclease